MARKSRRSSSAITIAAVAEHAGVSPMSVSNFLNGRTVRPKVQAAVTSAIQDLGYVPNSAARELARGISTSIGLLHGRVDSPFSNAILACALTATADAGAHLLLEPVDITRATSGWEGVRALQRKGVKAVLLPPVLSDLMDASPRPDGLFLGMMAISPGKELERISTVRIDETAAAREMVSLLISKGHKRIGFIRGLACLSMSQARLEGYVAALKDHSIIVSPELIVEGENNFEKSMRAGGALLDLAEPPTAIFASNDEMAAGALVAAHVRKLAVPEALQIAGFDDSLLAQQVWPALSSVRVPVDQMTRFAVDQLIRAVRSGQETGTAVHHHRIAYTLVQRESTGTLPVGHLPLQT